MIKILLTSHGGMAEGMVQSVKMLIGEQEHLETVTFAEDMGADAIFVCYSVENFIKDADAVFLAQ